MRPSSDAVAAPDNTHVPSQDESSFASADGHATARGKSQRMSPLSTTTTPSDTKLQRSASSAKEAVGHAEWPLIMPNNADADDPAGGGGDPGGGPARQQHRNLWKLTDKVLLKRTQLRNEQGQVVTCRAFLRASTDALAQWYMEQAATSDQKKPKKEKKKREKGRQRVVEDGGFISSPTIPHSSVADNVASGAADNNAVDPGIKAENDTSQTAKELQKQATSSETPKSILAANDPAGVPPAAPVTTKAGSGLAFVLATTAPSDEAVADATRPDFRDVGKPTQTDQLSLLHEQYIKDYDALEKAEATLHALMDNLSSLEFRLEEAQTQFATSLRSPDFAQQVAGMFSTNLGPSIASSEALSVTDTPPLMARYFDRRGDVGVYEERLQEEKWHYQEGVEQREFLKDRGDSLEASDEEYENTHRRRREAIEKDLEAAKEEADDLARQCGEAGLDIDAYRTTGPPMEYSSGAISTYSFPDLPAIEPITPGLDHFQTPAIGRANKPMPNDLQIGKWLSGLAGGEAEGEESTKVSETPLPKSQSTEG